MPTQKKIFPRALDPPLRPTLTESFEIQRHTEDGRAFLTSGKDKKKLLRRHTVQSPLEKHAGRRSTKLLQKMSWPSTGRELMSWSAGSADAVSDIILEAAWGKKDAETDVFNILYTHMQENRNWDLKKDYVRIGTTSPWSERHARASREEASPQKDNDDSPSSLRERENEPSPNNFLPLPSQ